MEEQEWIDRINQAIVFANSQSDFRKESPRAARFSGGGGGAVAIPASAVGTPNRRRTDSA